MNELAIIMTAFNAGSHVLQAIDSLDKQTLPEGWTKKFYIGVDGCEHTAKILSKNKIPYFYSNVNVGTYILTNSLLETAYNDGCEIFVRFDSDDCACTDFLYLGIINSEEKQVTTTTYIKCDENLIPLSDNSARRAKGSIFFSRFLLEQLGGYHHYRVSCDKFFLLRAKLLGFKGKAKQSPRYWYRTSTSSLTGSQKTGINSAYREEVNKELERSLKNNEFKIDPVTTNLVRVNF